MPDGNASGPSMFSPLSWRRITTSGSYIPEVDGLRFVAILAVVLFHVPVQIALRSPEAAASNPFWHFISHGSRGVQLFFLISGFILGMPFAAHLLGDRTPVQLSQYFLRRVTRLEPPYIVAILIRLPLLVLLMHKPLRFVLAHGLASLLYVHSLVYGYMSTINPPGWSLEVEIQFYCMAPLFALVYFRLRPAWLRRCLGLLFLLLAGVVQTHFFPEAETTRFTLSIVNYVQYFFGGFLLCDLYLTDWDKIPTHWLWDVSSIVLWAWIFLADGRIVHVVLPVAALAAYVGAFKGLILPRFFRTVLVSAIGGMCYSIYLTHNLAITAVAYALHRPLASTHLSMTTKAGLAYAATIPTVFAFGLALYLLVERPCMDKNWPAKLRQRFSTPKEIHT
jgi:peptidoglycan/LPS O-acetylase OafA/YrhL